MKAEHKFIVNQKREELHRVIPISTPYAVNIDVCTICNFSCKYCAVHCDSKFGGERLSWDELKKIISDLKRFNDKTRMLRMSGLGEPLLHKELPEMIKYVSDSDVAEWIEFATNGSMLNEELICRLVDSGVNRIRISIQGLDEISYYEMCGYRIKFQEFIDNIRLLYEKSRGKTEIYIKIMEESVDTEEKKFIFFDLFENICDKINIEHVVPNWAGYEMQNNFDIKNFGVHGTVFRDVKCCPFPFYNLCLYPGGIVTFCHQDWERKIIVGNYMENTLHEMWNSKKHTMFLRKMLADGRRAACDVCNKCEYPAYDSIDYIDPYADEILKRINKE